VIKPPARAVVDARHKPGAGLGPVDDVRLANRQPWTVLMILLLSMPCR
jgi:hypothetical protein